MDEMDGLRGEGDQIVRMGTLETGGWGPVGEASRGALATVRNLTKEAPQACRAEQLVNTAQGLLGWRGYRRRKRGTVSDEILKSSNKVKHGVMI